MEETSTQQSEITTQQKSTEKLQNQSQTSQIPHGYLTIEEFRTRATQDTIRFCETHGIH